MNLLCKLSERKKKKTKRKVLSVEKIGHPITFTTLSTDLVGVITTAPISLFFNGDSLRNSFSMMGITKASVLPDPVTAYINANIGQLDT